MAEREGFEPSVPLAEHDDLANRCLRPLGHLSKKTTTPTRQIAPYTTKPIPRRQAKFACRGWEKQGTAKTQLWARNASGSIGRSAASPLTAPAALRFAPCRFSESHPSPRRGVLFSVLRSLFSVLCSPGRRSRPFGAIAWKSQGRRDQRERWSPQGFHAKPSSR